MSDHDKSGKPTGEKTSDAEREEIIRQKLAAAEGEGNASGKPGGDWSEDSGSEMSEEERQQIIQRKIAAAEGNDLSGGKSGGGKPGGDKG